MCRLNRNIFFYLILLSVSFLLFSGFSSKDVRILLDKKSVTLGEEMILVIDVSDAPADLSVKIPEVENLNISAPSKSQSSNMSIVNGKTTMEEKIRFSYTLYAANPGDYTLKDIEISGDGQGIKVEPIRFSVIKNTASSKDLIVQEEISRNNGYKGEALSLTYKVCLAKEVQGYEFRMPLLKQDDIFEVEIDESKLSNQRKRQSLQELLSRQEIPYKASQQKIEGVEYTVIEIPLKLYPLQVGNFSIPPVSFKAKMVTGYQYKNDYFWGRQKIAETKTLNISSKGTLLQVDPLPLTSDGYRGNGIGTYSVNVTAQPLTVKVGDPITLQIQVIGDGNLKSIEKPLLSEEVGFSDFLIDENLSPGEITGNQIVFEQVIRPRSDDITEIPSVRFQFFDPLEKQYIRKQSPTIPIKVLPTKLVEIEHVSPESQVNTPEVQVSESGGNIEIYAPCWDQSLIRHTEYPKFIWLKLLALPFAFILSVLIAFGLQLMRRNRAPEEWLNLQKKAKDLCSSSCPQWEKELYDCLNQIEKYKLQEDPASGSLKQYARSEATLQILNEAVFAGRALSDQEKKDLCALVRSVVK